MKCLSLVLAAALTFGACSSAAAPGAGDVMKQVDKAEELEEQVERRNAELDVDVQP